MAIRSDSYGSEAEVVPLVRYLLDGSPTFTVSTNPTQVEVEKMIDRISGILNHALAGEGFTTPINSTNANSTAKLLCDDWVVMETAGIIEMTKLGVGFSDFSGSRAAAFRGLHERAREFAKQNALGLKRIGAAVTRKSSDGLQFTGLDAPSQRDDPFDNTLVQPKFTRDKFDHDGGLNSTTIWGTS